MGSRLETNSARVSKRIADHTFDGEDGEEYSASTFGGFSDYMRRKKLKLQNLDTQLRSESIDKPQIFKNIVCQVNGYTQPSLSDLHVLIVSHGGGFLQYLDGKTAVTHIIASQLTPKKKEEFAKYRVVRPAWIVDSVNAGRLLPWENYRLMDEGVTQKILGFENGVVQSQRNKHLHNYKTASEQSWYNSQVQGVAAKLSGKEATDATDQNLLEQLAETNSQDESFYRHSVAKEAREHVDQVVNPMPTQVQTLQTSHSVTNEKSRPLTAEEHNAILLQNPHMAKSSTANPDFLNQYYRESRLHHLSTWKAELKAQLQARANQRSSQQKTATRAPGTRRYVMHVDFDSFFCAVGLRKNPHLKEKPVVVAHGSGPGSEIASCNYPARKYGIKNGMWMKHALELCTEINVLPYDYPAYEEASKHFYDSILAMDGVVQSISVDEALIDVSDTCIKAGGSDGKSMHENAILNEQKRAIELAESLRADVRAKTGCEISIGIGANILQAKVALRKAKPAGQFLLKPEAVLDFLADLTIVDLPGFAYSVSNKLEEIGVKYVKDIRVVTKERLMSILGPKTGEKIFEYSRGIDRQEVGEQVIRKSVSAEVNWGIRFITQAQADEFVACLCEEVAKRLLDQLVKGRQLTLKVMRKAADAGLDPPKNLGHGKCDTFNKSVVLGIATNDGKVIGKEAVAILRSYNFPPGELRGLGVQMQKLEPLKPLAAAAPAIESNQRRLQFKKPAISPQLSRPQEGSVIRSTPLKSDSISSSHSNRLKRGADPIEEEQVPTPTKKAKASPTVGRFTLTAATDGSPLNISGTQFLAPTQMDPSVVAELPEEIRRRLISKPVSNLNSVRDRSPSIESRSRSQSPYVSEPELALPNQSQLDPVTLAELPDEVREELLAQYKTSSKLNPNRTSQQLLPQSPRKARLLVTKKQGTTPTKKTKTRPSLLRKTKVKAGHETSSMTQSNFVSSLQAAAAHITPNVDISGDISASFLEGLPGDIKAELMAEQKRQRIQQKSGLNLEATRKNTKKLPSEHLTTYQRVPLPARPQMPTFTSRKLSKLSDLRGAVSSWIQAFSENGEDGPYHEDTESLAVYLGRVITEEKDMAKALAVIDWLRYVVADWPFHENTVQDAWTSAIKHIEGRVQSAMRQRGLPPLSMK